MKWAVRGRPLDMAILWACCAGSPYQRYENAVKLEEATYVTQADLRVGDECLKDPQAAPDPTFIYWSRDPIALKDSFYKDAANACLVWSLVYFGILAVLSFCTAWRFVPRRTSHCQVTLKNLQEACWGPEIYRLVAVHRGFTCFPESNRLGQDWTIWTCCSACFWPGGGACPELILCTVCLYTYLYRLYYTYNIYKYKIASRA